MHLATQDFLNKFIQHLHVLDFLMIVTIAREEEEEEIEKRKKYNLIYMNCVHILSSGTELPQEEPGTYMFVRTFYTA